MTDTSQQIIDAAVESIQNREYLGQSPVPTNCVYFDVRADGRKSSRPSVKDVQLALLSEDHEIDGSFDLDDVPESEDELEDLLMDDHRVELVDGGYQTNTDG